MKSSFINYRRALLLLSGFFIFSFTTKAGPGTEEVNSEVLLRFTNSFTTAKNVTWKVTKEFSKASFTEDDKLTEVFYNHRNRLIGTAVHIPLKELPAGGAENITGNYDDCRTISAIRYTNRQGETSYFVQLENDKRKMIVQVDEQGQTECVKTERK